MEMTTEELNHHKDDIELNLSKVERAVDAAKTNHFLHIILSIITVGIWIVIWLFIENLNKHKRSNLEEIIDESRKSLSVIDSKLRLSITDKKKKTN